MDKVNASIRANKIDNDPMFTVITSMLHGTLYDMNFRFMSFKFNNNDQLHSDAERVERAGYEVGVNGNKLLVYLPEGFEC